jgi:hypothetical protein
VRVGILREPGHVVERLIAGLHRREQQEVLGRRVGVGIARISDAVAVAIGAVAGDVRAWILDVGYAVAILVVTEHAICRRIEAQPAAARQRDDDGERANHHAAL